MPLPSPRLARVLARFTRERRDTNVVPFPVSDELVEGDDEIERDLLVELRQALTDVVGQLRATGDDMSQSSEHAAGATGDIARGLYEVATGASTQRERT